MLAGNGGATGAAGGAGGAGGARAGGGGGVSAAQADEILGAILERERQFPTGIGYGVAVPHGRCPALSGLVVVAGTTPAPSPAETVAARGAGASRRARQRDSRRRGRRRGGTPARHAQRGPRDRRRRGACGRARDPGARRDARDPRRARQRRGAARRRAAPQVPPPRPATSRDAGEPGVAPPLAAARSQAPLRPRVPGDRDAHPDEAHARRGPGLSRASRLHAGEFYALPQSPQIYKQLLMVCGFDRYFQIARCFRDEDLRYDRQPEFTQIDLEAAFVGQEDVLGLVEAVLVARGEEAGPAIGRPFQRLTHREAMERYGTDKPDQRYDLAIADWTAHVRSLGVPFFQSIVKDGSRVRGLAVKGGGALSRKDVDQLAEAAKQLGAAGLAWVKRQGQRISGSVGKHFTTETLSRLGVGDGDVALMTVGPDRVTSPVLDKVRQEVIRRLAPRPTTAHAFCWVVEFPLFEPDPATGSPVFAHHPFTSPHPEDVAKFERDQPA